MHYAENGKWGGGDTEYEVAGGGGRLSLAALVQKVAREKKTKIHI
jgi:hypothetical protein